MGFFYGMPLDTPDHVRQAWHLVHSPMAAAAADAEDIAIAKKQIRLAAGRMGIFLSLPAAVPDLPEPS